MSTPQQDQRGAGVDGQRTGVPEEARQAAAKAIHPLVVACAHLDGESECEMFADAALAAALPHLERQIRDKIADEIETHATSECSENASRREDPEMWADLDEKSRRRGGTVALHYPVGRCFYPCEGCEAAKAADESVRLAARVARGEG